MGPAAPLEGEMETPGLSRGGARGPRFRGLRPAFHPTPRPDPPEEQIDDVTAQHFRELLEVNLVGYFLTAKFALPYLRETRGNIINISSLVGVIGQRQAVPYVTTKGAVTAMTKAMAVDESRYGVRVNRYLMKPPPPPLPHTHT
uniref:Uncharacterized protein n=1 Tax=Chelydra serpentina TaxID=8475 RepID=A0A8C3SH47_CHESE